MPCRWMWRRCTKATSAAFRALGGVVTTDAEVLELSAKPGGWQIDTRAGRFRAETMINAAGAWGDVLAALADLAPLGLQPKRTHGARIQSPGCL